MPRYSGDSGNCKWVYDHGKERRAILGSYVCQSISPASQVAKEQHEPKGIEVLIS